MANVIENVITARDEATPKLQAVRAEIGRVTGALNGIPSKPAPGLVPHLTLVRGQLSGVGAALTQLAPQASAALGPMQSLTTLSTAGLGPLGIGLAGLAVTVGTLATVAKKAADEVAALGEKAEKISNLSESLGVSAANVQGLQVGLENAGIPAEALVVGFRTLNRAIADGDPALKQYGITTKDTYAAFLQLSDLFARSADGPNKTAAAIALMGRNGQELIPVMNRGSGAIRDMVDNALRLGLAFSDDTIRKLKDTDDAFDKLKNQVEGLKNQMVLLAVPGVSDVVAQLTGLLEVVNTLPGKLDELWKTMQTAPGTAQLKGWYDSVKTIQEAVELVLKTQQKIGKTGAQFPSTVPTAAEAGVRPDVPAPPAPKTAPTEREQMLKRLQELLRLSRTEAQLAYDDLKRLDDSTAAASLEEKLRRARTPNEALRQAADFTPEPPQLRGDALEREARAGLRDAVLAQADLGRTPDFEDVALAFQATLDEMMESANLAAGLIGDSFSALSGSLTTVFQGTFAALVGLPGQIQSLSKAVLSIIQSMVNQALAALAKLAAAKVFKLLLSLFGAGLPASALAAAAEFTPPIPGLRRSTGGLIRGPGTAISDSIPARLSAGEYVVRASAVQRPGILSHLEAINRGTLGMAGFSAPASTVQASREAAPLDRSPGRERSGGNTYVIQAINARDAILSLTQPGGEMRRAMDRVAMMGAY